MATKNVQGLPAVPAFDIEFKATDKKVLGGLGGSTSSSFAATGRNIFLTTRATGPCGLTLASGHSTTTATYDNIERFHVGKSARRVKFLVAAAFAAAVVGFFAATVPDKSNGIVGVGVGCGVFALLFIWWYTVRKSFVDISADGVPEGQLSAQIEASDSADVITTLWDGIIASKGVTQPPAVEYNDEQEHYWMGCIPDGGDRLTLWGKALQIKQRRGLFNLDSLVSVDSYNWDLDLVRFMKFGFTGRPITILLLTVVVAWGAVYPGVAYNAMEGRNNNVRTGVFFAVGTMVLGIAAWWLSAGMRVTFGIGADNNSRIYASAQIPLKAGDMWRRLIQSSQLGFAMKAESDEPVLRTIEGRGPDGDKSILTIYQHHLTLKTMPRGDSPINELIAPTDTYTALLKDVKYVRTELKSGFRQIAMIIMATLLTMAIFGISLGPENPKARTVAFAVIGSLGAMLIFWFYVTRQAFLVIGEPMPREVTPARLGGLCACNGTSASMFESHFRALGEDTDKLTAYLVNVIDKARVAGTNQAAAHQRLVVNYRRKARLVTLVPPHSSASLTA